LKSRRWASSSGEVRSPSRLSSMSHLPVVGVPVVVVAGEVAAVAGRRRRNKRVRGTQHNTTLHNTTWFFWIKIH
jgi:hypothetical protein